MAKVNNDVMHNCRPAFVQVAFSRAIFAESAGGRCLGRCGTRPRFVQSLVGGVAMPRPVPAGGWAFRRTRQSCGD